MKYGRMASTSIILRPPFKNRHLLLAAMNLIFEAYLDFYVLFYILAEH